MSDTSSRPKHILAAIAAFAIACGEAETAQPHVSVSGTTLIAACGREGDGVVTLRNSGTTALTWTATSDLDGVTFEKSGSVASNGSADIHLHSIARDPGLPLEGTITFATNDPVHATFKVPVRVQRSGPRLSVDTKMLDFGVMPLGIA